MTARLIVNHPTAQIKEMPEPNVIAPLCLTLHQYQPRHIERRVLLASSVTRF
jgi:hypothetical protein